MKDIIKKNWVHGAALLVFFAISVISFYPVFDGKKLNYKDSILGMSQEVREFKAETGEVTRWTNSMFGGMPTYYIYGSVPADLVDISRNAIRLFSYNEVGNFFAGMMLFYFLMILLGGSVPLSIFAAICFAFTTNNLVLLETGHVTKLNVILTSPLIVAGLILSFRSKVLLGSILFSLGLAIGIKGDHPQMTYYLAFTLLPFMAVYLYKYIKEKKVKEFLKICVFLLVGLFVALGTTASKLLPVQEYSAETMRGKPLLTKSISTYSSSSVEGLSWEYAMSWSNGAVDLLQSFIPFSVGGSNAHMLSSESNFAAEMRRRGANTRNGIQAPMYWGKLPFTSGPIYFGAIVFMLFVISIFTLKDQLKWWLLAAVVLTFLLSMGRNFEILSKFFYDFVPMYNKFRTPNSILSVTPLIITIGAFWGLSEIIKTKVDLKKVLYPGLALASFCVLYGVLSPSFLNMTGASDARYAQMGLDLDILMKDRAALALSSSLKSAILMLLSLAAIWAFYRSKIKKNSLIVVVGLLCLFDFFTTNAHYVTPGKYVSNRTSKQAIQPRVVDTQILKDVDPHYRVLDLSIQTFESASSSYYHKTIGGYHAAKLVRYQDMIDYHISNNNMNALNMLNTKYIIENDPATGKERVQRNTTALGNAWFVNNVKIVNSNEEEIEGISNFDPLGTALVHKEFEDYLSNSTFQQNGNIQLTSYKPNELKYTSTSSTEQLAIFSEVWYGPDKGWKAYIDGQYVEHIRANYILRALKIPSGKHEIKFVFDPDSVKTGALLSKIFAIVILGFLFIYIVNFLRPEGKRWFNMQ